MADYGFQFKSPTSYGDWASYAGFDRVTGETDFLPPTPSGVKPASTPVAPPTPTDTTMGVPAKPTLGNPPKTTGLGMSSSGFSFGGSPNDLLNAVNKHLFGE
jgi:hypothetical protein